MKYFLDTEFYEDGKTIDLISIAVVSEHEDGPEFYAVNQDAQLHRVNYWVRENVLSSLPAYGSPEWMQHSEIGPRLREFCEPGPGLPEFWGYYADYDWVAVCQLFGSMMKLPPTFPRFCRDLKQMSCDVGSPKHPPDPIGAHNALVDARWNRDLYAFLSTAGKRP
jgi:hypothetical protein